jgi:hypothetical protein
LFDFGSHEASLQREIQLNKSWLLLKSVYTLFFDGLIPILIVPNSFEKLHQIFIVANLFIITHNGRSFNIDLPVDFFNALPNLFFVYFDDDLVLHETVQILDDGLEIKVLCLWKNHVVLSNVGEVSLSQVASE